MKDWDVLEAMTTYGGSFVVALANCAKLADQENYNRLKESYKELWERYSNMHKAGCETAR